MAAIGGVVGGSSAGGALFGGIFMFLFATGASIPIIAIMVFSVRISQRMEKFGVKERVILVNKIKRIGAGLTILVGVGIILSKMALLVRLIG